MPFDVSLLPSSEIVDAKAPLSMKTTQDGAHTMYDLTPPGFSILLI